MSGTMYGADISQLRGFGGDLDRSADRLNEVGIRLSDMVAQAGAWKGPDAEKFRAEWSAQMRPTLQSISHSLENAAKAIKVHADEQDEASRDDGGVVGGAASPGVNPGVMGKAPASDSSKSPSLNPIDAIAASWKLMADNPWGPFSGIKGLFDDLKDVVEGPGDLKALGALRDIARSGGDFATGLRAAAHFADDAPKGFFGNLSGVLGKWGGITGVVGGIDKMLNPGYEGLRGWGDRLAGVATVLSSGAGLMWGSTGAMALALGPVGATIVVGAGIAAAAWSLGNLVVDNWSSIKNVVADPGKAISDAGKSIKKGIGDAGNWVANKWKGIFG